MPDTENGNIDAHCIGCGETIDAHELNKPWCSECREAQMVNWCESDMPSDPSFYDRRD